MNWTGKLAHFFIKNGKLTFLILISLFLWGYMSFLATPKKYNPTIVAPAFQVTVKAPGSSQEEVLEQITKPLENVITDIDGVEDIYSATFQGGMVVINVNFYVGEDLNQAKVALSDRLRSDAALAPMGIMEPEIVTLNPEEVPVLTIALTSDKLNPIALRKKAWLVRDQLSQVEGTSRIAVYGGQRRELQVLVDPKKLKDYGVSLDHIEGALKQNNAYLPSGFIKARDEYRPVEVNAWVKNPDEIKNIILITNDTVDIKLSDVAQVLESPEERISYLRHVTKEKEIDDAVLLAISKLQGENISDVTQKVQEHLDRNEKLFSLQGFKAEVIVDKGQTAKEEIDGLLINLISSIIIVIIVLFFFLNIKAAALVAIAIPLTLASVFGFAFLFDQTINRITLFALILSLGMLVDNATVVIENIVRMAGAKKTLRDVDFAEAVNEVGPGLFMSTVTTVLAFIPMAFISGMMGPYMGPIPFFIPVALVMALFISYSINPWMASILIKRPHEGDHSKGHKPNPLEVAGMKFIHSYRKLIKSMLVSAKSRVGFLLAIFFILMGVSTFPFVKLLKFRMLPKADVDQFFLYVDLPENSPLEKTYSVTKALEKKLLEFKEVKMIQSYVGTPPVIDFNGLFKGVSARQNPYQATLRVGLLPDEEREATSEELVLKWREILNESVSKDITLQLIEDPPGPPVLSTVLLRIQGDRGVDLVKEAAALNPFFNSVEQVVDTDVSRPLDNDKYVTKELIVNHYEASRVRIPPAQIIQTLRSLYSGRAIGIYHNPDNIEQEVISLRIPRENRDEIKEIEDITLRNPLRISVPLSRLVTFKETPTVFPLRRENHRNTIYLTGEMGNRSVTYAGIDLLLKLIDYRLADGKGVIKSWNLFGVDYQTPEGKNVHINIGGEWELTLEVFRDLMLAMAIAIIVIYIVLVAQFNSFKEPLIIMSTIPLSVIGVFPGFAILNAINGEYFTATSMIGVIALAGIAVNNSIILLEYLNSLKIKELDLIDALVEACATRLRPIALTTITTMLGSMTILGDPVWSGLAWAIILGLGMSSTLILFVFPLLYYSLGKKAWPNYHNNVN
jgi:multidrug efflux pump subunit AcrB